MFELYLRSHHFPVRVCPLECFKGKTCLLQLQKRLFLTHTSQSLTSIIPKVCTAVRLSISQEQELCCPHPAAFRWKAPCDQLSLYLSCTVRNGALWSRLAKSIGCGWIILAFLKMTILKPKSPGDWTVQIQAIEDIIEFFYILSYCVVLCLMPPQKNSKPPKQP